MTGRPRPNDPVPFDPALGVVREKFRAAFEDHILEIEALKNEVRTRNSRPAMDRISTRVHNIAGVAATLGFGKIGSIACSLEASIRGGLAARSTPVEILGHAEVRLEELLDGLEAELD